LSKVIGLSHNELLMVLIAAISQSVYTATHLQGFNSVEVRNAVIRAWTWRQI